MLRGRESITILYEATQEFQRRSETVKSNLRREKENWLIKRCIFWYVKNNPTDSNYSLQPERSVVRDQDYHTAYTYQQERIRTAGGGRACNYLKFKTGQNYPPVLNIVTCTAHASRACWPQSRHCYIGTREQLSVLITVISLVVMVTLSIRRVPPVGQASKNCKWDMANSKWWSICYAASGCLLYPSTDGSLVGFSR